MKILYMDCAMGVSDDMPAAWPALRRSEKSALKRPDGRWKARVKNDLERFKA